MCSGAQELPTNSPLDFAQCPSPARSSGRKVPSVWSTIFIPLSSYGTAGPELLPQGHEGGHLRTPESEGVQRAPGVPPRVRRLSARARHALHNEPLGAGRPALPPGGVTRLALLHRVGVA